MKFIYAKRPFPQLEFGTANRLDSVPLDAEVLAICDGPMTIRRNAPSSIGLTHHEQSTLDALIEQSQESENCPMRDRLGPDLLRRLISSLLNL